ncbi:hypothetical protein AOR09_16235 [Vibrio alginolyticus]|nr:hypothetical protein AOR09_16235 [Vibrio alginolyticus]KPM96779.1 hypothetical protein AOG25_17365 [Vibrio alginolyticus]
MLSLFCKVFACENFKTWHPIKFSHAKTWAHIDAKTNIYIIFLVKYRFDSTILVGSFVCVAAQQNAWISLSPAFWVRGFFFYIGY